MYLWWYWCCMGWSTMADLPSLPAPKLWFIIHPKTLEKHKQKCQEFVYALQYAAPWFKGDSRHIQSICGVSGTWSDSVSAITLCTCLYPDPNSIIMPPWAWHLVYTPVGCVRSSGHFLMYDTMHLIYISHQFDMSSYPNGDTETIWICNQW